MLNTRPSVLETLLKAREERQKGNERLKDSTGFDLEGSFLGKQTCKNQLCSRAVVVQAFSLNTWDAEAGGSLVSLRLAGST